MKELNRIEFNYLGFRYIGNNAYCRVLFLRVTQHSSEVVVF